MNWLTKMRTYGSYLIGVPLVLGACLFIAIALAVANADWPEQHQED
jgi:hypothetical protein